MSVLPDRAAEADEVLPTFAVMARFAQAAGNRDEAVREVVGRLTAAHEPFHEVTVAREADGLHLVVVRFVLVSVDASTAVAGLHETLVTADLVPDEVWSEGRVS